MWPCDNYKTDIWTGLQQACQGCGLGQLFEWREQFLPGAHRNGELGVPGVEQWGVEVRSANTSVDSTNASDEDIQDTSSNHSSETTQ